MTAKSAINALSKNMAWALAKDGILVNTVTPGVFWTEGLAEFIRDAGGAPELDPNDLADCWRFTREFGGGRYNGVIGRVARAEELAPLLLLLGSRATAISSGPTSRWMAGRTSQLRRPAVAAAIDRLPTIGPATIRWTDLLEALRALRRINPCGPPGSARSRRWIDARNRTLRHLAAGQSRCADLRAGNRSDRRSRPF